MIDFRFGTAFRNNLTDEEEAALDHMLDMMTAIKQQILLRRVIKEKSKVYRLKDNPVYPCNDEYNTEDNGLDCMDKLRDWCEGEN